MFWSEQEFFFSEAKCSGNFFPRLNMVQGFLGHASFCRIYFTIIFNLSFTID